MAGKRQHFIPKFLQEGFSTSKNSSSKFVWIFKAAQKPYKTNTVNSGVESLFYCNNNDTSLDTIITDLENNYCELIRSIRAEQKECLLSPKLPELFVHMEIRTRHIRNVFKTAAEKTLINATSPFEDETKFKQLMTEILTNRPELIEDYLRKEFKKAEISQELYPYVYAKVRSELPNLLLNFPPELSSIIQDLKSMFEKILPNALKAGHINALMMDQTVITRLEKYSKLKFKVFNCLENNLILGDSIVLFETENSKYSFGSIWEKGIEIKRAYLPISSSKIIVGSLEKDDFDIDFSILNEEIAKCSSEFFIADKNSQTNLELSNKIGTGKFNTYND